MTKHWKSICLSSRRSPLSVIPVEKLFPDGGEAHTFVPPELFEQVIPPQSRPGPENGRWKLPPSEWPRIVERTDRGEPLQQIANDYGVSYPVVRKAERLGRLALNLPPRSRPCPWKIPEAEWPRLLDQIERGMSLTQIGRGYGVTRKVVKRIEVVARQRLQRPAPLAAPSYPGRIAPSEWATILARLDAGETFDHLARDYGVAPVTIRRIEKLARKALGAAERPRYRHWSIPPSEWPTIVVRIDQGASQRQLAKEYGVSPSTIKVVNRTARLYQHPEHEPSYREP